MDKSVLLGYMTLKKCPECSTQIVLETELENLIFYKDRFHHISCLKIYLISRARKKMSPEEADEFIAGLRKETDEHAFSVMVRNHLKKYLVAHYNLIDLSTGEYQKLEEMWAGKFKNMTRPIYPEHMIDMLQRRGDHYDQIMRRMRIKPQGQVNYLLGMILKDYPGYLAHLEKREIERQRNEVYLAAPKIDYSRLSIQPTPQASILDDEESE